MSATEYVEEKLAPGLIERRYPSGKVVYRSSVYADGERFFRRWEGVTRTEAKRLHVAHGNEVKNDGARPGPSLTLGQLRDEAFAHFETLIAQAGKNGKKPRIQSEALANHRSAWRKRVTPYMHGRKSFDEVKLADLDRKLARAWLTWLASTGVAPSTQNGTLSALRSVLRYARDNDYMTGDPFAAVPTEERPSQGPRGGWQARVFSQTELGRVVAAAHSPAFVEATPGVTLTHVIEVLAFSGLRLSEAAGLTWRHVDLVSKVLSVDQQRRVHKAAEPVMFKAPKSARGVRSQDMLDPLYEALLAQLDHEQAKGLGRDDDLVFTTSLGTPVGIEQIKSAARRATRIAGLGEHGPQVLRRSFATQVAHAHITSIEAEAILGHSAATFEDNYAKPLRDAEQRAENKRKLIAIGLGAIVEAV